MLEKVEVVVVARWTKMDLLDDEQPQDPPRRHDLYQMEDLQLYLLLRSFESPRSGNRRTTVPSTAARQLHDGQHFHAVSHCRCRHETSCPQTHRQHTACLYLQSWIIRRPTGRRRAYFQGGRGVWNFRELLHTSIIRRSLNLRQTRHRP